MEIIKKLYNYYMMVMVDLIDGEEVIVTGEELKDRLTAMGFTVPEVVDYEPLPLIPYDVDNDGRITNEERVLGDALNKPIREENARRRQAFFDQFLNFADFLEGTNLQFARYAKMKKSLPNGRPDFRWLLEAHNVPIKYKYTQAADLLMGRYTKGAVGAPRNGKWVRLTPIEFIAFERFG